MAQPTVEMVELLLFSGADVHARDNEGINILQQAKDAFGVCVSDKGRKILKLLIDRGATE